MGKLYLWKYFVIARDLSNPSFLYDPNLYTWVDRLIYVDADTLLLQDIEDLANLFDEFNESQIMALAEEASDGESSYHARFPAERDGFWWGDRGVNTGVMLMDLRKMVSKTFGRRLDEMTLWWFEELYPTLSVKTRDRRFYQDLLNAFFRRYSSELYVLPCKWNFRPSHLLYGHCPGDIGLLHGAEGYFTQMRHSASASLGRPNFFDTSYDMVAQWPLYDLWNRGTTLSLSLSLSLIRSNSRKSFVWGAI